MQYRISVLCFTVHILPLYENIIISQKYILHLFVEEENIS